MWVGGWKERGEERRGEERRESQSHTSVDGSFLIRALSHAVLVVVVVGVVGAKAPCRANQAATRPRHGLFVSSRLVAPPPH